MEEMSKREISLQVIRLLGLKTRTNINSNASEVNCHCPYHRDDDPSMFINLDTGIYNCFSCHSSGRIEWLFKDLTGQSIYSVLGLNLNSFSNFAMSYNRKEYSYENNLKLKNVYINYDSNKLKSALEVPCCVEYLKERGITELVAQNMNMLYSEDTEINLTRFYRRLVIPIYEDGKLISFEGRRIFNEDPEPKVLYVSNCTVNTLYDIDNLDKDNDLFFVEGLMDLAVLRSCKFFKNSTSIFGASVTNRQKELLKQFKRPIYIFDRDDAGKKSLLELKKSGLSNIFKLELPPSLNIKDVGDLPKIGLTPQNLVDRNWLNHIEPI